MQDILCVMCAFVFVCLCVCVNDIYMMKVQWEYGAHSRRLVIAGPEQGAGYSERGRASYSQPLHDQGTAYLGFARRKKNCFQILVL